VRLIGGHHQSSVVEEEGFCVGMEESGFWEGILGARERERERGVD
jgi:hypothetical protein